MLKRRLSGLLSPSAEGKTKKAPGRSKDGLPLQTFAGRLKSLSRSQVRLGADGPTYSRTAKPTSLQARALELFGLKDV
jgi:hypothetical protein